jgi:hypothetical protein
MLCVKDVNRIYFPAPIPKYIVLYKPPLLLYIPPSLLLRGECDLEHTI